MLRQARNEVRIEGILLQKDIEKTSYKKDGVDTECIRGTVTVLVEQVINNKNVICEIPVQVFANKITQKKRTINPSYTSWENVMNDFVSAEMVDTKQEADRIRLSGAQITSNDYYSRDGKLVSYPRISASFARRVPKDEFKPEATFDVEMVIANQGYEVDADGVEVEPKRYKVKGIIPGYGGRVEVIDFVCSNENTANSISSFWQNNDTVKATGKLNFSSKTETYVENEGGFGEKTERTRTIRVSEIVLTGGLPDPLDGDFAYDINEIQTALAERKARIEASKERDMARLAGRPAPAAGLDLGF